MGVVGNINVKTFIFFFNFFFNDTATTEIYTLSYTTLFRSHVGAAPLRFVCGGSTNNIKLSGSDVARNILCHQRNEQGQLYTVAIAEQITQWGVKQNNNGLLQGALFAIMVITFLPFFGMEQVIPTSAGAYYVALQFTFLALFLATGVVYFLCCRRSQTKTQTR